MYELYIYHVSSRPEAPSSWRLKRVTNKIEHYYADKFSAIWHYAKSKGLVRYSQVNRIDGDALQGSEIYKSFIRLSPILGDWREDILIKYPTYEIGYFFNFYKDGVLLKFDPETGFPRGMVVPQKKKNPKKFRKTPRGNKKLGSFLKGTAQDKSAIEWEIQECEEYIPNVGKQWRTQYTDYNLDDRAWDWSKRRENACVGKIKRKKNNG